MSASFESTRIQAQTAELASRLSAIEWITDSRVERLSQDFYWFSPVLKRQLEIYDEVVSKKSAENPLFKEILESQIAFAQRATQWERDTVVDRKMAYDHYFGPQGKLKKG